MTAHFTAHRDRCQWSDGDIIITDSEESVNVRAGSAMRGMPCIACLTPAGSRPVAILHVALGEGCSRGHGHLYGLAVLIHEHCPAPSDDVLLERVSALVELHRH